MLVMRLFNRQNALKFADYLYHEKNGYIHYQPLCEGTLAELDGREAVCCVLGEMYEHFVGKPIYEGASLLDSYHPSFKPKDIPFDIVVDSQHDVVHSICRLARRKPRVTKDSLIRAVNNLASVNDRRDPWGEDTYVERARACAVAVRNIASAYLM